jgi:hypothetical protein
MREIGLWSRIDGVRGRSFRVETTRTVPGSVMPSARAMRCYTVRSEWDEGITHLEVTHRWRGLSPLARSRD